MEGERHGNYAKSHFALQGPGKLYETRKALVIRQGGVVTEISDSMSPGR